MVMIPENIILTRGNCQKQEYLDRKQERGKEKNKHYTDNRRLWIQAFAPDERSLVEFKDEMLWDFMMHNL